MRDKRFFHFALLIFFISFPLLLFLFRGRLREISWKSRTEEAAEEEFTPVKEDISDVGFDAPALEKAELVRVVDGDTIKVIFEEDEQSVRLIGIDAPESVNPDESKNTIYGKEASDYLTDYLKAYDTIYLEFGIEQQTDVYDRLLAYVWLEDVADKTDIDMIRTAMLNGILVYNGYALSAISDETKYLESFSMLEKEAYNNNSGLWASDGFIEAIPQGDEN